MPEDLRDSLLREIRLRRSGTTNSYTVIEADDLAEGTDISDADPDLSTAAGTSRTPGAQDDFTIEAFGGGLLAEFERLESGLVEIVVVYEDGGEDTYDPCAIAVMPRQPGSTGDEHGVTAEGRAYGADQGDYLTITPDPSTA